MASPKMASMSKALRPSPSSDYLLCIQMTNSTPLSPQAQAVLDAVCDNTEPDCDTQHLIAAALRAAVDQVVPEPSDLDNELFSIFALRRRWVIRDLLLAIADELEGADG